MLHSYQAILTASDHMRSEYLKHGFSSVKVVPLPVQQRRPRADIAAFNGSAELEPNRRERGLSGGAYRLLFVGRMDLLKGGGELLDALVHVLGMIGRPLQMTFVGDGPERRKWEEKAARLQARESGLSVSFTGWLGGEPVERAFSSSDLLVVPSLWPEPFGLVGPEAGLHGLPAAAFDVGGISDWLTDGVNGYLASGDPPAAEGLARAILKCLCDPAEYARLRNGALEMGRRFSPTNHLNQLTPILENVAEIVRH